MPAHDSSNVEPRPRNQRTSSERLAYASFALLVFIAQLLLVASLARGEHGPSSHYSRGNTNCEGSISDPVGVIFRGDHAGLHNTGDSIAAHTDWSLGGGGPSFQGLFVYNEESDFVCEENGDGRSQNSDPRFHVRLWNSDPPGQQQKTVGTPHWEEIACELNHAVFGNDELGGPSGFDIGRQALRGLFDDAGHETDQQFWGNDQGIQQCDGDIAASNGHVARITLPHFH